MNTTPPTDADPTPVKESSAARGLGPLTTWMVAGLVVVVIVVFVVVSLLVRTQSRGSEREGSNTMWVWQYSSPHQLVDLADSLAVDRLLVWVSPGFTSDTETMSYLGQIRSQADRSGITVDALGGDPEWALQPALANAWAAEVHDSGLFERLHLDVEPNGLETWPDESSHLLDGVVSAIEATKSGAAGLPVDVDIPYWLGDYTTSDGSNALEVVLDLASSVTVMAYQPDTTRILRVAQTVVDAAQAAGVPVFVGLNVAPATDDHESSTLRDADFDALTETVTVVAGHDGVAGAAIHDARSALALYDPDDPDSD